MSALAPDRTAIENFLAQVGGEAIQLVTFPADGGPPQAHWFGNNAAGAAAWAEQRNAVGCNIYWSVNEVRAGLNKKASKEDVVTVRFCQLDLDPPKDGGTFDKAAAVAMLRDAEVPPHVVVDSGGGIQALWRVDGLDTPAVEVVNKSLIAQFNGDPACWNVDRILRVAGTINHPNAKKRVAGRVPAAAALLAVTDGRTTAAELTMAYGAAPKPDRADTAAPAAVAGLASLDALGLGAADPLRQLLVDPAGDDRSADTFAAACGLARAGYSDDQIAAVLLDPELPISAHCLAQGTPERAAERATRKAREEAANENAAFTDIRGPITATPYGWPAAHTIPPRRWLYGRQLLRGTVSVIVAPGATGKSALTVAMALALVTGRPLLGKDVHGGPKRCWLYGLEDAKEEQDRSVAAAAWAHNIKPADAADRLFLDSGLTDRELCTAIATRQGHTILRPVYRALSDEIMDRRIDCLIVDPFVSSHTVNENDNGAIDAVVKAWAKVAAEADCAIVLVHHTSKAAGVEVTVDRARGASALTNAARSVVALNRMTLEEAMRWGIEAGEERRYVRYFDDKNNRAPPAAECDWFYLESVDLPNGEGDEWVGDSVGAAVLWQPPTACPVEQMAPDTAAKVQALVAQGEWRESERAERWAGKPIAQVLGLDIEDKPQRSRIKSVLRDLLTNGTLAKEERKDASRQMRTWIVVGSAPPTQPAKSASGPVSEAAPVSAPLVQPSGALVQEGSLAVHRTSQIPLGIDWSGAERTAASNDTRFTGAKGSAEAAAASLGQISAAPVASDGSEFL